MKKTRRILTAACLLAAFSLQAQTLQKQAAPDTASKPRLTVSGSVELASGYIWRGDRVCGAQFTPTLTLGYGRVSLQGFGYLALDGSYKEIDWDLSCRLGDFSLHVADYFFREASSPVAEDYFNWKKGETNHVLEGIVCYEPERLPFAAKWFTFFYGDWLPQPDGSKGKASFSSYLELEAYHRFGQAGRLSLFMGSSVLKGAYTNYTRDFAVIHLELRYAHTLTLGKLQMPLGFGYIVNPYRHTSYLNASVGVCF
ncbi:MAG: hypothetical protein J5871_03300 [Bacteroidales bacterium]|nr:hypothetical protein [Bacteroidales bacterium]